MSSHMKKDLQNMVITTSSGKDVCDTKMKSGEASDSLYGKNELKEYKTSGGMQKGKLGGKAS